MLIFLLQRKLNFVLYDIVFLVTKLDNDLRFLIHVQECATIVVAGRNTCDCGDVANARC